MLILALSLNLGGFKSSEQTSIVGKKVEDPKEKEKEDPIINMPKIVIYMGTWCSSCDTCGYGNVYVNPPGEWQTVSLCNYYGYPLCCLAAMAK